MTIIEHEDTETQEREAPPVGSPVVAPVTTRELLHRAGDLIEEFGWCQHGNEVHGNDPFCIGTAMQRALFDYGIDHEVSVPLWRKHLDSVHAALGSHTFVDWNDTPGRTKAEVVARLRQAAEAS